MAINKCNEVHGACRHKPKFHRFDQSQTANTSTDESDKDKRVFRPSSTTPESTSSANSVDSFLDQRESSVLHPNEIRSNYWNNRMNGLQARFQMKPGDLPQVDSNLEEPPQDNDLELAEGLSVDV